MTVEKKNIRTDIPGHHTYLANAAPAVEEMRRMTVGRDITLCGEITDCEHLSIEGRVEARAFSARRLDVLEHGVFAGIADVQQATIAGRFDGKLTVRGKLSLKPTAVICGELVYSALEAEPGCRIEGTVSPLTAEAMPHQAETRSNVERLFGISAGNTAEHQGNPLHRATVKQ